MARQPDGLAAAARRCSRSTSTTRSRPAPPTAPASSPARSGSTPARWSRSCARAARRAGRSGGAGGGEALEARSRGPRAPACGSAARWRGGPSAGEGLPGAAAGRRRRPRRQTSARGPPPPSTSPPARTGSSAANPVEALVDGLGRAGHAGLDPRRRRRQLLRAALELEGLRRGPPAQGERDGRAALEVERGGGAADRDRRRLLHPRRSPTPARGC